MVAQRLIIIRIVRAVVAVGGVIGMAVAILVSLWRDWHW
jgi:hypothetical protein